MSKVSTNMKALISDFAYAKGAVNRIEGQSAVKRAYDYIEHLTIGDALFYDICLSSMTSKEMEIVADGEQTEADVILNRYCPTFKIFIDALYEVI